MWPRRCPARKKAYVVSRSGRTLSIGSITYTKRIAGKDTPSPWSLAILVDHRRELGARIRVQVARHQVPHARPLRDHHRVPLLASDADLRRTDGPRREVRGIDLNLLRVVDDDAHARSAVARTDR